jgi:hypothetical protein
MGIVNRRDWIVALLAIPRLLADDPSTTIRGKLSVNAAGKPVLATGGKIVLLEGDDATTGVLKDKRVAGMELEAIGHFRAPDAFTINPIHTKAMFVRKDDKRLYITYWCDVCSIRTYSPGKCWCCQEDTELDLRERYE